MTSDALLQKIGTGQEYVWVNPNWRPIAGELPLYFTEKDVREASDRFERFAPVMMCLFPETRENHGIVESPLKEMNELKRTYTGKDGSNAIGRLFMKMDSHLAVAGSVKARGGFHDVLWHTEKLAIEAGILKDIDDDYSKLLTSESRTFFSQYKMQVASTGNLGMSIGIMSAALGYEAIVHMSADAKQWKKDRLRRFGVKVIEYAGDYGLAIQEGRKTSEADPSSYFVDDENSAGLFLGYAVAGERLAGQLAEQGVTVDENHPMYVYLPCGVGGAPGGITLGLKLLWGDHVHCIFCEPTQAPCMLAGLASGLHDGICVQDIGLTGVTEADGLAVGRPSKLVGKIIEHLIDGEVTVADGNLYRELHSLWDTEHVFIEPSSCAAISGMRQWLDTVKVKPGATHVLWATGGSLVPMDIQQNYLDKQM